MKKTYNQILSAILMGTFLLGIGACKENTLVIPDQIPLDDIEINERGPVKQNNFQVIVEDDEKVRFDISSVDTELVESVFFSYNRAGAKEVTEVKDFESLYIIENLPVGTPLPIEVWAKGKNGVESKKFSYVISPLPFPSKGIINNINVEAGVKKVNILMLNLTKSTAILYYKIDNAAAFKEIEIPISTSGETLVLKDIPVGKHTVTYYVKDAKGGESDIRTVEVEVQPPVLVDYNTAALRAGWTPYASNSNSTSEGPPSFMLDGNLGTIWHTQWSTTVTSDHSADKKYPFTLIFTFTQTRAASATGLFNEEALKSPAGPYKPIIVKEVTLLHRAVGNYRVKDIELYGIKLDGTEVKLGNFTLANDRQDNIIPLPNNETLFKAVKIICLTTFSTTDRFANMNEIYIKGYDEY